MDFTKYIDKYIEEIEALKFYDTAKNMDYHIEFFKAGINAIIGKWLDGGCKEEPEEINEILMTEYQKKNTI